MLSQKLILNMYYIPMIVDSAKIAKMDKITTIKSYVGSYGDREGLEGLRTKR